MTFRYNTQELYFIKESHVLLFTAIYKTTKYEDSGAIL